AEVTVITDRRGPGARITVAVQGVAAPDLAALSGGLAFLGVLDAPISGRIETALDAATGTPAALAARLDLAAGAVTPAEGAEPLAFDHAVIDLAYDPVRERLDLAEVRVESPSLRLSAQGHAYTPGAAAGLPSEMLAQIALNEVRIDPEGLFVAPAAFTGGALDLRLRLRPFAVDIGQLVLLDGDRRLSLRGRAAAEGEGWRVALDAGIDAIAHDRLLALWPLRLVPRTRDWLAANVQEGTLSDISAAVRIDPGAEARLSLTYDFEGAGVRFVPTLPPIRGGAGYATVEGTRYTLVLDRGEVVPPQGGPIAVAGSVFAVPDITARPARAEIDLATEGSLTATLSLLDQPPFGFLTRAGREVDLGEGRARVAARLELPLVARVLPQDVDWRVQGVVEDLRSEVLVPDRLLAAERLSVSADPSELRISGPGTLAGVAFDATYALPLGPGSDGGARVEGTLALSADAAQRLGLGLPQGMLSGQGQGRIAVDLPKGGVAGLRLSSDLRGLGLSLPEIGWSKGRGASGRLEVVARLSTPAVVERLALEAPGLAAQGRMTLRPGGGLDRASFDRVRAGGWFEGPVTLVGRGGRASPDIAVGGGRPGLRAMPAGLGRSGGGAGGGASTITARLDRLQITETIGLTALRGTFSTRGGLGGEFLARVNGGAPVQGRMEPGAQGAIRVTAQDAGGVLSSAGIFPNARGGSMVMQLRPRPQGGYDGRADFAQVRVRNTPVLAELLNAASIVGLLEQLNGSGILFQEADATFRLSGAGVEIAQAAAVGASIGVSMQGIYDAARGRLDLQGTISPFYLVNGIGAILTRRGEGLFGINYRITGSTAAPVVSVNPLSMLTPGMFREIFRRPPPRIAAGG
ncbi:MAG TPA: AsmA-like C-terminal region-containing protein, partial [Paracoccaceae bacterium]|nr:AsmA-like C-terminal region-containing protein [Paracoccaceae bacterium]